MVYSLWHSATSLRLALAIAFDTVQQTLWKKAASGLDSGSVLSAVSTIVHEPLFLVIAAILPVQLWNWLRVLDRADLSYALPVTAVSYATVGLCSYFVFGETLSYLQIAGIGLIIGGVWCIAQTDPSSDSKA